MLWLSMLSLMSGLINILHLPSFLFDGKSSAENGTKLNGSCGHSTSVDHSSVVGIASPHDKWALPTFSEATGHSKFTTPTKKKASAAENAPWNFRLSGKLSSARIYREKLKKLYSFPGGTQQRNSITATSGSGCYLWTTFQSI